MRTNYFKCMSAMAAMLMCADCGGVRVQPYDAGQRGEQAEGFRFYRSKPYVVVSRQDAADGPRLSWRLVYLPDKSQEYVIRPRRLLSRRLPDLHFTESGLLAAVGSGPPANASGGSVVEGVLDSSHSLEPGLYEVNWMESRNGSPKLELGNRVLIGGPPDLEVKSVRFLTAADRPELPHTALIQLSRLLLPHEQMRIDLYHGGAVKSMTVPSNGTDLISLGLNSWVAPGTAPESLWLVVLAGRRGSWSLIGEGGYPPPGSFEAMAPAAHLQVLPAEREDEVLVAIDYDRRRGSPINLQDCGIAVRKGANLLNPGQYQVQKTSAASQLVRIPTEGGQRLLVTVTPRNSAKLSGNSHSLQLTVPSPPQPKVQELRLTGLPQIAPEVYLSFDSEGKKPSRKPQPDEGMRPLNFIIRPKQGSGSDSHTLLQLVLESKSGVSSRSQAEPPPFRLCELKDDKRKNRECQDSCTTKDGEIKCSNLSFFDVQGNYIIEAQLRRKKREETSFAASYCACFDFKAAQGWKTQRDELCGDYAGEICRLLSKDLLFPGLEGGQ